MDRELTEFHRAPGWNSFCWTPKHRGWDFVADFCLFCTLLTTCCLRIHSWLIQSKNKNMRHTIIQITVVKSLPNFQLSALLISLRVPWNPFCFLSQPTPGVSPCVSWLHPRGHVRITSKPAANIIARHITQRLHRAKVTCTTWKKICRASRDVW